MKESLISAAVIFVVVAIVRTVGTAVTGTEPPLITVVLEAAVCALLLTPVLQWIRPASTASAVVPTADDDTSTVDPISNTLNSRGLTINLLESMALSEGYSRELSVVMLAMDDTDDVFERHGDSGVEAALEMIGDTLVQTLRVPDRAGRYERDVFLLILPETDVDGGSRIAERIRRQVVDLPVKAGRGESFSVTSSAGVAAFRQSDDPQLLITRAEAALEEARRLGQNRTIASSA